MAALTDLVHRVGDALSAWRRGEGDLRQRHTALIAERGRLVVQLPARAELVDGVKTLVQQAGAQWTQQVSADLIEGLALRLHFQPDNATSAAPPSHVGPSGIPIAAEITFPLLCALLPEQMVAGLTTVVQALPYEPGPPMRERVKRLAQIEDELVAIETEHATLRATADEQGLTMARLDPDDEHAADASARERIRTSQLTRSRMYTPTQRRTSLR